MLIPRSLGRRFAFLQPRFRLAERKVLDVGAGSGAFLRFFGPGSVGIDINQAAIEQARRDGLDVRLCNVETDPLPEGPFEVVWCSNLLEHLLSPHSTLIKFRTAGALLILTVPVIPRGLIKLSPWRLHYKAKDHVNAFTSETLQAAVEFAGWQVREVIVFPWRGPQRPVWSPRVTVVAEQVPSFAYGAKSPKIVEQGTPIYREYRWPP